MSPISAENRQRYPKDWKAISLFIRARAGWRCECAGECGLHPGRRCMEENNRPALFARGEVCLTVAHLDHQPENCAYENLKAMCQRCHLRYDAEHHAQSQRIRRERESGQISMELE